MLRRAGYRTALLGKAHFQPHLDLLHGFDENRLASQGQQGPRYGFDHVELAGHGPTVPHHYTDWLHTHHPVANLGFATVLTGDGGSDTGVHDRPGRRHGRTDDDGGLLNRRRRRGPGRAASRRAPGTR